MNQLAKIMVAPMLFALCAFWFSAPAQAEEPGDGFMRQVWINPGTFSYHFDRDKNLRGDNTGIGAEWVLAKDHALAAGSFINSNRERSHYGAYYWRPLHWQPAGIDVHVGIAAGAFDGYPNYRNGAWFPAALPVLTVEGKQIGANIFFVPTIKDRTDGAISVQLKLRVW